MINRRDFFRAAATGTIGLMLNQQRAVAKETAEQTAAMGDLKVVQSFRFSPVALFPGDQMELSTNFDPNVRRYVAMHTCGKPETAIAMHLVLETKKT